MKVRQAGIRALLEGMARFGWKPILEGENIIGLSQNGAALSLEPGGQFELSGAAVRSVHETCVELNTHRKQVREVCAEIGAGCLGVGYAPTWTLAEVPVMPKGRYAIMRRYMPKVGGYGLEMMFRTCTVQGNFDFSSEADMVKKFRVALALQPVATALFANSPFREGKPNGFLSYRSHIWTDVDNDRAGMLPFVFETGFGFERYVDYALDVPMYFVYRDGRYIDVAGKSFRHFLEGRIPELKGHHAHDVGLGRSSDDDLSRGAAEILSRSARRRWRHLAAHLRPAGAVGGIFYDQTALDAAWDLVKDWTAEERETMRAAVPKLAFKTPFRKTNLQELARRMLEIATHGLRARAVLDSSGASEVGFLEPLQELVDRGQTRADELLALYRGEWNGDLSRLFEGYNFL